MKTTILNRYNSSYVCHIILELAFVLPPAHILSLFQNISSFDVLAHQ